MPKRKLYRCKLCDHETTERVDKWQHIKTHVTPDKLLTCNSCPFVTEYKHHLEYHQRNHNGVKPFKCEQCDYRCVNRSMLKSHSKSHSSVCPYQCGECRYATKYAHSLKMHLKKYCHNQQLNGSLSIVTSSSPLCKVEKDLSQKHLILTSGNKHGASSTSPAYSSSATSTTSSSPIPSITPTSLTPTSATIPNSAREPNLDILDLRICTKTQAGKT